MWLSDGFRFLLLGALLALAACGYSPAYAPGEPARELHVGLIPDPPSNENDLAFVSRIESRLATQADRAPRYRLGYEISTVRKGVGLTPDQEIVRYNIFGKVRYELRDAETGAVLTSGSADSFTSYSVGSVDASASPPSTNATIATAAAERDAYARLMAILADQVLTRLVATADRWAQ